MLARSASGRPAENRDRAYNPLSEVIRDFVQETADPPQPRRSTVTLDRSGLSRPKLTNVDTEPICERVEGVQAWSTVAALESRDGVTTQAGRFGELLLRDAALRAQLLEPALKSRLDAHAAQCRGDGCRREVTVDDTTNVHRRQVAEFQSIWVPSGFPA